MDRLDNQLKYWITTRMNNTSRGIICNGILISATIYFLAILGGTVCGVKWVESKIRNVFWTGQDRRGRARMAWKTVCRKREDGGLNMINMKHALTALLCKWIVHACKPGISNFKFVLRYRLAGFQPYIHGKWDQLLEWFTQRGHVATTGSKVWG